MNDMVQPASAAQEKIVCHIDNQLVHSVQTHIQKNHSEKWTIERYKQEFPDQPLLSEYAKTLLERRAKEKKNQEANDLSAAGAGAANVTPASALTFAMATFHDVFDLGAAPAAMNASGNPISIKVFSNHDPDAAPYLSKIDPNYVFDIELTKKVIVGMELNMPIYLWGYHGTGKTTVLNQVAARTRRPFLRVQHTLNMQESEILGQWVVRNGQTEFQLGPLPMAMLHGWVYCADEYDFAMPNVTAVYQPVLEGEALLIKDAPLQYRKIEPHPEFRFCATGNTNGVGDETGLYQGTMMQNAANYSRFRITEEVKYMDPKIEETILVARANVPQRHAAKVVKFANEIRRNFADGKIGMTVSPRELIGACQLAAAFGGKFDVGLNLAFANRLSRVDRETINQTMQRMFGSD